MDSDLNIFLNALRNAINNDPNQFNRAKTDSMYDVFRPQVDALLNEMYQEVKKNAEKEYHNLDYNIQKMKEWFDNEYSSSEGIQEYEKVLSDIHNAKEKLKNQNYVSYVDAINIMNEAWKTTNKIHVSIKNDLDSIKNNIDSMEKELNSNNTVLKNNYSKKDGLIQKIKTDLYKRTIIAWGLLIVMYSVILIDAKVFLGSTLIGLLGIIVFLLSFTAMASYFVKFYDDAQESIGSSLYIGFIAMIMTFIIYGVLDLVSTTISEIFGTLLLILLIFWPFIIQDKNTKSEISKFENNEKAIKERISILSHKIQIAKEAI